MLFAIAANLAECFSNLVTHKAQPFFKFQVDPTLLEDGWIKWNRRSSEPKDGNNLFLSHTIQVLRSPASTNHHGPCNRLVAIARLKQMWCIATKWCATCRRSQELNLDMGLSESMVYLKTRNVTVVIIFPIGIAIWWVYPIFRHTYVTPMWHLCDPCQQSWPASFFLLGLFPIQLLVSFKMGSPQCPSWSLRCLVCMRV